MFELYDFKVYNSSHNRTIIIQCRHIYDSTKLQINKDELITMYLYICSSFNFLWSIRSLIQTNYINVIIECQTLTDYHLNITHDCLKLTNIIRICKYWNLCLGSLKIVITRLYLESDIGLCYLSLCIR